ncbi:hypothetical protein ATO6_16525 [Oceanicola sp. 22II-s10i]|uniref:SixA phosphatase family protein n=1 Tax=Oceanicola sp. 22II-s10i TaxID=1317116 RepID=UPI000B522377|nr:histidine phosphatase family protein [Oceanicola sp. 22II-s10i]OWU84004.1 hypothetical protein ATO6_16525 [Oceanicola sp. 22II-s10i]
MTKRLIVIRHAKAVPGTPALRDFDRTLNKRGQRSAEAIGAWLARMGYLPDLILCSSAQRTRETAQSLGLDVPVRHEDALYEASPDRIMSLVQGAQGATVAVIGHNPGIGGFAADLLDAAPPHGRFFDYPTCATLVADFDADDWPDVSFGTGRFVNFITPRELIGD